MHPVLDEGSRILQDLGREQDDGGGTIADFGILRFRDVDQCTCRRVDHFEQLENSGAIVGDRGFAATVDDQLVHATWTERRANRLADRLTRANVREHLRFALCRVRSVLEDDDHGLHSCRMMFEKKIDQVLGFLV